MTSTIAIVAAGAMGSAIAGRLIRHGVTVLTSLAGRSQASRLRAETIGMRHAEDAEIVAQAQLILSIVPPAQAVAVAERFAAAIGRGHQRPVFVDCNAVGVDTVTRIGHIIEAAGGEFVDGAIIGSPPSGDSPGPTIYLAGGAAGSLAALGVNGLTVRVIDGPIGAASALKLSYAGITKGLVGIATAMILAAERAGAGQALKNELALSQPALLSRFSKTLPEMYPKAYRWIEEMNAIALFIGENFPEAQIFDGAAGLFSRIAADVAGTGVECRQIDAFLRR